MNVAKAVRLNKEKRPELYCGSSNCLWRLSSGPCPKHPKSIAPGVRERCGVCGEFRHEYTEGGFHRTYEKGQQNSANPSGTVPSGWEQHVWVEEKV